jgi:hypothetical protein
MTDNDTAARVQRLSSKSSVYQIHPTEWTISNTMLAIINQESQMFMESMNINDLDGI